MWMGIASVCAKYFVIILLLDRKMWSVGVL
jgi:hypothetical protein